MIFLVRHGQTEMNSAGLLQGRSDHPLNRTGIMQAEQAAALLQEKGIVFNHVFSSPLIRAVQTAEIMAPNITPVPDERLIEMDYGPYEGSSLKDPSPEIVTFFSDFVHNPAPPGMEPLSDVTARLGSFLQDIMDLDGNILVSTHAIALKGALEYLTPASDGSWWSRYIGNCAVFMAENRNGMISEPTELR